MRLATLVLAAASLHAATTHTLLVTGPGGEPAYEQRFAEWAREIEQALPNVRALAGAAATRPAILDALAAVAKQAQPQDAVIVMLIGHGTFDGRVYKFNVPGPDITADELAAALDRIPARNQLVANMTSASGASLAALEKPGRIVISATRTGTEKNATIFAQFWAEALKDPAADTDKNDVISAREAFDYAERKTKQYYDEKKLLATEHPTLEGKAAAAFTLARFGPAAAASADPAKRALVAKKEQLERSIEELKSRKDALPADEYKRNLTALLLELAKTQEALDK